MIARRAQDAGAGVVADRPGGGDPPDRIVAELVNHNAPSGPVVMPPGFWHVVDAIPVPV